MRTHGAFDNFLIEQNLCPACLTDLTIRPGRKVCFNCGFEHSQPKLSGIVPMGETRSPTNQLALNRSQGETLGRKGKFFVLARGPLGVQDLPIRSRQISIITQKFEHPKVTTLLKYGRLRAHKWKFDDHTQKQSIIFSNQLGQMLRKIGAFLIIRKIRISLKDATDACFALTLKAIKGDEAYKEAINKLNINPVVLETVIDLNKVVK